MRYFKRVQDTFIDYRALDAFKTNLCLKNWVKASGELEDYLGCSIADISRDYWQAKDISNKDLQDKIEQASSQEDIVDYYRQTSPYLNIFNESSMFSVEESRKLFLACKKFGISCLLDYGGGAGGLCIYLNARGIRCDYLDIPGKTFEFARWRFKKRQMDVRMLDALDKDLPQSKYEAVVAWDVLEHIFDTDNALKDINRLLKKGGLFINRSTFSGGGVHLKKNEIYQDMHIFNCLLEKSGFRYLGRLKSDYLSQALKSLGFRHYLGGVRISKRMKYGGNFLIYKKVKINENAQ